MNKQHTQNMALSAWLLWIKRRQTGRPKGDLQITIPLSKPCWDCYLQFNCNPVNLHIPSLITVDLACVYFWTFSSLLSCAPFTRIIAIIYSQCGRWEMPWRETYSWYIDTPHHVTAEGRPGKSLLPFAILPSNWPIFFPTRYKIYTALSVFICTHHFWNVEIVCIQ